MKKQLCLAAGVLAAVLIEVPFIEAYELIGTRWPSPSTTFGVDIPGAEGLWNSAFGEAMSLWNDEQTVFRFSSVPTYRDPCSDSLDMNGVAFSDTLCEEDWGRSTLAVTRTWSIFGMTTQSDILFNGTREWDVYTGPVQAGGRGSYILDFRRVAVHELGHALGLGHEEDFPSIMAPYYSNIEAPQVDDIAGVMALYGEDDPPPGEDPPPNDLFSNALAISGASGSTAGSNVGATVEPGESGWGSKNSVWWQWRPASSGVVTIDTVGSTFKTILGVYTGTMVSALRELEQDSASDERQSRVTLQVAAGITYKLRVASYYAGPGDIVLNWNLETASDPAPPNNDDAYQSWIFPQIADGSFSDGTFFRTTISLANERSRVANCHLILYGMDADFGAGRESSVPLTVPAYGVISVRTTGTGRLQSGYATVGCDRFGISGQLTYATYDASGTKIAEATVFPTEFESFRYSIIVDGDDGARLGLAIANNTDLLRTYDLTLWDQSGGTVSTGSATVPARSNSARFLYELISPPPASGIVYLLEIQSSDYSRFSMIGIRVTGSVLSTVPTH